MKTLILIIILFITPFLITEKEHITIRGEVSDLKSGKVMSDCHIYVKDLAYGTITGKDGSFTLRLPKNYANKMICISHVGYDNHQQTLGSGSTQKFRVRLATHPTMLRGITIRPDDTRDNTVTADAGN